MTGPLRRTLHIESLTSGGSSFASIDEGPGVTVTATSHDGTRVWWWAPSRDQHLYSVGLRVELAVLVPETGDTTLHAREVDALHVRMKETP